MKQMKPASRNTAPWDPLCGSAIAYMPMHTRPVPMISSMKAASTVRQFSRTFGWRQQYVVYVLSSTPPDRWPYSWINESLSRDVVSSVYLSVLRGHRSVFVFIAHL